MTTFSRMDTAISYAVDAHAAGVVITMDRITLDAEAIADTVAYEEGATPIELSYIAQVRAGQVIPEVYQIVVVTPEGTREWTGDIHVYRWSECKDAPPLFFHFYAA